MGGIRAGRGQQYVVLAPWPAGRIEDLCGEKNKLEKTRLANGIAVTCYAPQPLAMVLLDKNLVKLPGNYNHYCRAGPLALAVVSRRISGRG
jgi:hypothetical protein